MIVPDVERFTEGDCWLLAKRLHRITGWPLCSFKFWDVEAERTVPGDHGFVMVPDGRVLDIEGCVSKRKFAKKWGFKPKDIQEFDAKDMTGWEYTPAFGRYSYERARVVSERLLDKYDLRDKVVNKT